MKTMKFTKQVCSLLFISSLLFACSKDDGQDGATGPAGPQGEQGVAGQDGANGTQGEQGETGTANVIYSDWFNTELSNSIANSSASFTVDAPDISPDLLNFGTILVYGRRIAIGEGGNLVYQLPIVFGANRQQSYYYRAQGETIRITVVANQSGDGAGDGTFLEQYRYVLIPGGNAASGKSTIDFSKMSYAEVIAFFNISE